MSNQLFDPYVFARLVFGSLNCFFFFFLDFYFCDQTNLGLFCILILKHLGNWVFFYAVQVRLFACILLACLILF
jgi:hypothetical protein